MKDSSIYVIHLAWEPRRCSKSCAPQLPEAAQLEAQDQADVAEAGNGPGGRIAAFHIGTLQLDEMHSNMAKMRKTLIYTIFYVKAEVNAHCELQALLPCSD